MCPKSIYMYTALARIDKSHKKTGWTFLFWWAVPILMQMGWAQKIKRRIMTTVSGVGVPLCKPWALSKSECEGRALEGHPTAQKHKHRSLEPLIQENIGLVCPYLAVSRCLASMTSSRQSADGAASHADINSDKIPGRVREGTLTQPGKSRLSRRHKHVFL